MGIERWQKGASLSGRNRFAPYVPKYNLGDSMEEGSGTLLSVREIINTGDITLPSGALVQHCEKRFKGIIRNNDPFETSGFKALAFNYESHNADVYFAIGTLNLKSGVKALKGFYPRIILESTSPWVSGDFGGVPLCGGITIVQGTTARTAWGLQLTIEGGSLSSKSGEQYINFGTSDASRTVGYGIFANTNVGFDVDFIRAFNSGAGNFVRWQEKDGGGAGIHVTKFGVTKAGQAQAESYVFAHDTDTGIYTPSVNGVLQADQMEVKLGGTQRALFNGSAIILNASLLPQADNIRSSGSASLRWSNVFGAQFRPGPGATAPIWTAGTGSPEGVVTAPIGSLYTRLDGGAVTTLYIKETGTGNTGWVAK